MFRSRNVANFREVLYKKWPKHVADYSYYNIFTYLQMHLLVLFLVMCHQSMTMNHLKSSNKMFTKFG